MSKEPSFGYGGEPFGVQPQVMVLYEDVVNTTFNGYIYAELEDSPTDLEFLWYNGSIAGPSNGQAQVIDGIATFNVSKWKPLAVSRADDYSCTCLASLTYVMLSPHAHRFLMPLQNLYLNEEGGYIIRFILKSSTNKGLAWILSSPMSVRVGRPYALGLPQYPGSATAGELFSPQPIVAVLDRGGNVVKELNSGTIYASALDMTVMNSTVDYLRPIGGSSIPIHDGLGTFTNLYIDNEGRSYQITFTSSLVRLEYDGSKLHYAFVVFFLNDLAYVTLDSVQELEGRSVLTSLPFAVSLQMISVENRLQFLTLCVTSRRTIYRSSRVPMRKSS